MLITQPMALAREQRRRAAELRQTFDPSWFKRHCTVTNSMFCWSDMSWETRQICSRINGFTSMFCHSCRLGSCHMKEAQTREAQSTVAKNNGNSTLHSVVLSSGSPLSTMCNGKRWEGHLCGLDDQRKSLGPGTKLWQVEAAQKLSQSRICRPM